MAFAAEALDVDLTGDRPGTGSTGEAAWIRRSLGEPQSRDVMHRLYGLDAELSDSEYVSFAERWQPFRTWAVVLMRALAPRLESS